MRIRALSVLLPVILAASAPAAEFGSIVFYEYVHEAIPAGTRDGSFDLSRAYFIMTDKPAENLAYKLQLDAGRSGSDTADQALEVYIKTACVDWSTGWGRWTFGMQGMNLFNVQENTFGNRFLTKPVMDQHGFSSSADMGVGFARSFGSLVSGSLLYTNGTGFRKPEDDKYKKLSLQVLAGEAALNRKDGWNAGLVFSMEPISAEDNRTVMGVFGGWAGGGLRLGAEFDSKVVTGGRVDTQGNPADLTSTIIGVYGNWRLPVSLPLESYLQLDLYEPDSDTEKDGETGLILGLKTSPAKGLTIAPNVRMTSYEDEDLDADVWYRLNFEFRI